MEVLCFDPCILYHLPLAIQSDCDSRRLTRKHYTFVDFFFTWMIQVKKKIHTCDSAWITGVMIEGRYHAFLTPSKGQKNK